MKYILLDVMGIQRTIFETNRLKIIRGASMQLARWQRDCETWASQKGAVYISSAGGNVLAGFDNGKADEFRAQACQEAAKIGFEVAWGEADRDGTDWTTWQALQTQVAQFKAGTRPGTDYAHLPALGGDADLREMCVFCGVRLSSASCSSGTKEQRVCSICKAREEETSNAQKPSYVCTPLSQMLATCDFPEDTESLVGVGSEADPEMMAVVVFDLNNMGAKVKNLVKENNDNFKFLKCFSSALEKRVIAIYREAINTTKQDSNGRAVYACQPLMLAGDDAAFAVPQSLWVKFVQTVFQETEKEKVEGIKINVSAGVIVAAHNYPFSRLFDMAEDLCASAKSRIRSETNGGQAVDWHVFEETCFTSAYEARRRGFVRDEETSFSHYVCTRRPYKSDDFNVLVRHAQTWWKDLAERKRHTIYRALRQGPEETRNVLAHVFLRDENEKLEKYGGVWTAVEAWKKTSDDGDPVLWRKGTPPKDQGYRTDWTVYDTEVADSLELFWMSR